MKTVLYLITLEEEEPDIRGRGEEGGRRGRRGVTTCTFRDVRSFVGGSFKYEENEVCVCICLLLIVCDKMYLLYPVGGGGQV